MTSKMTDQIVRVVAAGGGVIVDADKMSDQLVAIAGAAAQSGGVVIVKGASRKTTDQLMRIANAGQGRVIFDLAS
ncbi:hypothetical protein WME97_08435 [Sorangium sp. So ce367]|uniref:hypothetical protein n=1 Tax=Sorangium sp. So ce367 TaxID=3133305 RepID=UPI003F63542A